MVDFKVIQLNDRAWIQPLLNSANFRGCEYSFSTLFLWRFIYGTTVSSVDDRLLVRIENERWSYLFPVGTGDLRSAINALINDAQSHKKRFMMHGVNKEAKAELESLFGDYFYFLPARDEFDYIYEAESLAALKGKKLHAKRNYIHRFLNRYDQKWQYEPINETNLHECMQMNKKWCKLNDAMLDISKLKEQYAVAQAFRHYHSLALSGGLLRVDGKVAAFSIGEPINTDTFLVHIEKAITEFDGIYPMINQQFVLHYCQDYKYVNREDDAGAPGLRKSKLSYHPAFLEEKYHVFLQAEISQTEKEEWEKEKEPY